MNILKYSFPLFLILILSCSGNGREISVLEDAEKVMQESPFKALDMIRNMQYANLNEEESAFYTYVRVCTDTASLQSFTTENLFDEALC